MRWMEIDDDCLTAGRETLAADAVQRSFECRLDSHSRIGWKEKEKYVSHRQPNRTADSDPLLLPHCLCLSLSPSLALSLSSPLASSCLAPCLAPLLLVQRQRRRVTGDRRQPVSPEIARAS